MLRALTVGFILLALAPNAWPDQTTTSAETLVRLKVQPMAGPSPALRYLLLPELREMNPGNPVYDYLKCFMEQQHFFFDKESAAKREKYRTMPLKELPAAELRNYGGFALKQADWAARLDRPDWQLLLKAREDGVNLLLPDLQQLRNLATALKVRFRAEVALGRFDDAVRTAKTLFALATHLGEHPTLIGNLVGIAVATVAVGPLEEMLEQPDCPNLYWALTYLPAPLVRIDKGLDGERMFARVEFRGLDEEAPMTAEQIQGVMSRLERLRKLEGVAGKPEDTLQAWCDAHKDEKTLAAVRQRLVAGGLPEARVRSFPADQVLLLGERLRMDVRRDDSAKLMRLPAWQVEALARQLPSAKDSPIVELFVPALLKVRRAQARLETRIALLRHVEALRLYAAEHDGKLPASLADVAVPLPPDPFTGQPFHYQVEGNTFHLRSTPPADEAKNAAYVLHYEVTISK